MKEMSFGKAIKGHSLPQTEKRGFPPNSNHSKRALRVEIKRRRRALEKAWRGSKKSRLRDLLGSHLFFKLDHDLFYLSLFYSSFHHV